MKQLHTLPTPCRDRVHTGLDEKILVEHRVHIPRPRPRPKTFRKGLGTEAAQPFEGSAIRPQGLKAKAATIPLSPSKPGSPAINLAAEWLAAGSADSAAAVYLSCVTDLVFP